MDVRCHTSRPTLWWFKGKMLSPQFGLVYRCILFHEWVLRIMWQYFSHWITKFTRSNSLVTLKMQYLSPGILWKKLKGKQGDRLFVRISLFQNKFGATAYALERELLPLNSIKVTKTLLLFNNSDTPVSSVVVALLPNKYYVLHEWWMLHHFKIWKFGWIIIWNNRQRWPTIAYSATNRSEQSYRHMAFLIFNLGNK